MKSFRFIVLIAHMIFKIRWAFEEIPIGSAACIPGGIQVIILASHFYDIPAVGSAVPGSRNQSGIHTAFQRQAVEKESIALTDGSLIYHGRIGRILQSISCII